MYGVSYLPGYIGLNNLKATDYLNVLLQALAHVVPFRDFWLRYENYCLSKSNLVLQFGAVMRKMWSPHNFKSTVSPQELMQKIAIDSKKLFDLASRSECINLFNWLLGNLQRGLSSSTKNINHSVIFEPFQGVLEVTSLTKKLISDPNELTGGNSLQQGETIVIHDGERWVKTVKDITFNYLSLDIPPCPLFRDSHGGLVIPQIPLFQILKKYDGETWSDTITKEAQVRRKFRIKRLPNYLILHLARFKKNNFSLEKNPTIVNFPVKNLEMRDYLHGDLPPPLPQVTDADIEMMTRGELIKFIDMYGSQQQKQMIDLVSTPSSLVRHNKGNKTTSREETNGGNYEDICYLAKEVVKQQRQVVSSKYDLVANICHDSTEKSQTVLIGDTNMSAPFKKGGTKVRDIQNQLEAKEELDDGNGSFLSKASLDNVLNNGNFKVHTKHSPTGQWYEIQDLRVIETEPQLMSVSESYMLFYEKKATNT